MIPFVDLKMQYRDINNEINHAIGEVLENAAFVLGPAVKEFEGRFAFFAGCTNAVGVNSGTSALHLALLALGIGRGDEVIIPAMTFIATAAAVEYTGATPVLVDVDPTGYTLDPMKIEEKITPRTRAVMPVHLYGQPADMDPIIEIADRHGLFVVEDAAQAHGAEYKGKRCGSMSHIAGFSFYPGKNLGAYGEGGAVTTNDDDLAEKVRALRDWGQVAKGRHGLKGFNYRMSGIQGAVLGVKMNHIEDWTGNRRRVAASYDELLSAADNIVSPVQREYARHVFHIYAVQVRDRDNIRNKLGEAGIASGIHYPLPIHLQPCFSELGHERGDFPSAEQLGEKELSLPMFPELTDDQIDQVVSALKSAVGPV